MCNLSFFKKSVLIFSLFSLPIYAETVVNLGVMSEYFYRGVLQNNTSTANGGIDYQNGGFYAGAWAADVEDGLEVDLYGGYGFELESGIGLSAGYTNYQYTGDFDDTYQEINLGVAYGIASIEHSIGVYDNFDGPEQDYTFSALTLAHQGFYGTVGSFGDDFDGRYFEVGYRVAVGGFDIEASIISNDKDLDLETGEGTETILFGLSKSFDL